MRGYGSLVLLRLLLGNLLVAGSVKIAAKRFFPANEQENPKLWMYFVLPLPENRITT